jgi:hypothetical protein
MTVALELTLFGVLFIIAFLIALTVCLSIEGKSFGIQVSALSAPFVLAIASFLLVTLFKLHSYYDHASMEGLGVSFLIVYLMIWACLWWVHPRVRARLQERRGGIAVGILLSLCCLALLLFLLRLQASILFDLITGPQVKQGVVQDLGLRVIKGRVHDGLLVVDGVEYRVPDMSWFEELSMGQAIEFLYGPGTKLAFAPDQGVLTPLAAFLTVGLLGPGLFVVLLPVFVRSANGQAPRLSLPSAGAEPRSRATGSLLRTIQERQGNGEKAEQAKQRRQS